MELKEVLFWILALAISGFLLLVILLRIQAKRNTGIQYRSTHSDKDKLKKIIQVYLQKSYLWLTRSWVLRYFTLHVRKRISLIPAHDEYRIRLRVAAIAQLLIGGYGAAIGLLLLMNPDPIYFVILLITAAVVHGVLLDSYVNRLHRKMLEQTVSLLSSVRNSYQRHGIVEEAILEAAEETEPEVARQAYQIVEALTSPDPGQTLEQYYESAPGRYLKSFAGISHLVMEYGDQGSEGGSVFLKGISGLTKEIHLELLKLAKLDYLLKGLTIIALAPLFFTKPVELWARKSFPLMDEFYAGKAGVITKLGIYVIIFLAYILLKKMKGEEESAYRSKGKSAPWVSRLYDFAVVRRIMSALIPARSSASRVRTEELLRDTDSPWRVEWFYLKRVVIFAAVFLIAISGAIALHVGARQRILDLPPRSQLMFGSMTEVDRLKSQEEANRDRKVIRRLQQEEWTSSSSQTRQLIADEWGGKLSEKELSPIIKRIESKLDHLNYEYLKWWEVLGSLLIAVIAYYAPVWLLMFQKRVRLLDMKHEIYQFYTMVAILREMERISVEEVLEWLYAYSLIYRTPIQKCLLHYEHGAQEALTELREESRLPEFRNLIDKLLLAVEKIPIRKAMDDLDHEMGFYFEQRRLDYEKMLDHKANIGKMIGFTPMYALVFCYLVIPLIWMSFSQMGFYYEQIQKIS